MSASSYRGSRENHRAIVDESRCDRFIRNQKSPLAQRRRTGASNVSPFGMLCGYDRVGRARCVWREIRQDITVIHSKPDISPRYYALSVMVQVFKVKSDAIGVQRLSKIASRLPGELHELGEVGIACGRIEIEAGLVG
jgi:hypothetical protein